MFKNFETKHGISGVKFRFNFLINSQQDGIAMGFPFGPTLANIFMSIDFIYKLFYTRYVDDCFVLVRSEKIMDEFFNILQNSYNSMSFTMKKKNMNLVF